MYNNKKHQPICIFLILIFFNSCLVEKETISQSIIQKEEYRLVSSINMQGINYQTIFTENNLDSCYSYYSIKLKQISTRLNYKLLFYNKIELTPKEIGQEDNEHMINSSLIGGIEKSEGVVYKLIIKNGRLERTYMLFELILRGY